MAVVRGIGFQSLLKGFKVLFKQQNPRKRLVPHIVGEAGIGKSALVHKLADDLGAHLREITCSLIQEGDLALPIPDKEDDTLGDRKDTMGRVKYALHTMLVDLIDNDRKNPEQVQILFLDEFTRATPAVQAELMNLVLQREIVGVRLPDNVCLVLASNPSTDVEGFEDTDYAVNASDAAIEDRVITYIMRPSFTDWIDDYGRKVINEDGRTQIHNMVMAFLEDGNTEYFVEKSDSTKRATPRSWEHVSNGLYQFEDEGIEIGPSGFMPFINATIQGAVGTNAGGRFITYLNDATFFIRPWDIIKADERTHKQLFDKFKEMQEVRKNRIVDTLVNQFTLKKQHDQLLKPEHTNRLVEWVLGLNEDSTHMMMLKIASGKESDFEDYKALYNAIIENDTNETYINKELEYTMRVDQLGKQ